tara:strand:- start:161 stop:418 length:258 start_codon:yes stop_codon:yes gene_type:complete
MNKIEIYTKNSCVFCDRAKEVFKSKNLSYTEYNVSINKNFLDIMIKRSNGQITWPQIFINNRHVGGFDHLKSILSNGIFDKLIKN